VETTEGTLLDGRLAYTQPARGFRSGIEPVLLAASVPARRGQAVLEAGAGAGAGLLCLAARVPGLRLVGVERDPALAALAARNLHANGFAEAGIVAAGVEALPFAGGFDHAFANPPYHGSAGTPSPDPTRRAAKQADPNLFARWTSAMGSVLRHRGTLTLILPAAAVPAGMAALTAAGCPPESLLPFWPLAGRPAKLVLLRGIKGGRSPFRIEAGLVLHNPDGRFTAEAESLLRSNGSSAGLADAMLPSAKA
jgi:tRNA1(Val) A37 N6-methylase TrmN6